METYSLIFYEYVIKLVTKRRSDSLMIILPKTDQFLKRANGHGLHSPRFPDSSSTDPCRGLIIKVWVISNKPIDCEAPCPRVAAKSRLKCCPGAAIHHPGLETEYQNCPDPTSGHLALLWAPRARGNLCKYWSRLLLDFNRDEEQGTGVSFNKTLCRGVWWRWEKFKFSLRHFMDIYTASHLSSQRGQHNGLLFLSSI